MDTKKNGKRQKEEESFSHSNAYLEYKREKESNKQYTKGRRYGRH